MYGGKLSILRVKHTNDALQPIKSVARVFVCVCALNRTRCNCFYGREIVKTKRPNYY